MDVPYSLYTSSTATTVTKASSNDDDYCYSLQLPSDMAALFSNSNNYADNNDGSNNYYYHNYYYAHSFPAQLSPPPGTGLIHWEAGGGSGSTNGSSSVSDAASTVAQPGAEEEGSGTIRAKIAAHPLYPKLLQAYIDCHKVGAPAETASLLDEMMIRQQLQGGNISDVSQTHMSSGLGADPELDDFMESYYEVLVKYKWEMWRPFDEATTFLTDIQSQFHALCTTPSTTTATPRLAHPPGGACIVNDGNNPGCGSSGSSDEDMSEVDHFGSYSSSSPPAGCCINDLRRGQGQQLKVNEEDRELKDKLIEKYGGYLSSLKREFSKKKKKGKLPKDARLVLLNWWNLHFKWPYPTEADKVALAETTGLDQKQINNWFINQRKRHWKPTENMQSSVVDSLYAANSSFFVSDYPHHPTN